MTDPIADFLTRIRNAIQAAHDDRRRSPPPSSSARWPASSRSRATSRARRPRPPDADHPGELIRIKLKYTERPQAGRSPGLQRVSRPGQRYYVARDSIPKVQGGMGTAIVSTSQGVMTGHEARRRASAARSWRRSGDGAHELASAASPSPSPPASPSDRARARARQRPQGRADRAHPPRHHGRAGRRRAARHAPDRPRRAPCPARPHALARGQHGRGRHRRLREDARDPGRRLPRRAQGHATSSWRSATRTRCRSRRPTGSSSRSRSPTRVIVKGISKQLVGEIAANIRKQRQPEPYKGKGIRYEGEYVARKVGKRA